MTDRHDQSDPVVDDMSDRAEQIADAAMRLFARYGFKRTAVDDIAKEARIAKATIYLHFKGKDDIFRATLLLLGQRVDSLCRDVMEMKTPFAERLMALLRAHHCTAFLSIGAGEHFAELRAVIDDIAVKERKAFEAIFIRYATQLIEECEARGEITLKRPGVDPAALITTLMQASVGTKVGGISYEDYEARLGLFAGVIIAAVLP